MKILITGAFGQLGEILTLTLSSYNEVIKTGRKVPNGRRGIVLDICNKIILKEIIKISNPDIIINLAAITNVDYCEQNPVLANQVNVMGVENICDVFSGKIIHLSSDYVFDGKNGPYREYDTTNPISIYGKTKLNAEKIIINHSPSNLIIRGNVIYSDSLISEASFLNWVIKSLSNKNKIKVVNDQYNNPTWTKSLANVICLCLKNDVTGLYHWGDKDYINRYEFALKIAEVYNLENNFIKPIKTSDLNQIAKRPLKSGLISNELQNILNVEPPTVKECLIMIKGNN